MHNKLKVWEIIPTLGGGGAEKMVLDLSQGLGEKCEVTIISLYGPEHASANRKEFADANKLHVQYLNKKKGFDANILWKLAGLIRKEKPDIIHSHIEAFQYVSVLSVFWGFVHVHTMHSIVGRESKVYQHLLMRASKYERTYFVVLSEEIGKQMKSIFGTRDKRLYCIPNGIDREYFYYVDRPIKKEGLVFITVGSLIPVKNQKMLIDAFSIVEKNRNNSDSLIILGDGSLKDELKKQIRQKQLEDNVLMPGNVSDVRKYLFNADAFVMTSHYEGVSLALLEAASTGLPIIVTNTGNTKSVVENDAILIEDNNAVQLAAEMQRIAENSDLRKQYIEKSINLSSRFDKNKMVHSYLGVYLRAINEKKVK